MLKFIKHISGLPEWFNIQKISDLSAQAAYYLLLSFFPCLIFLLNIAVFFMIDPSKILDQLQVVLPAGAYEVINSNISVIMEAANFNIVSIGFIVALWTASRGINSIIRGMNIGYHKKETRSWWKLALVSMSFTLMFSIMLSVSILLTVFGDYIGNFLSFHSDLLRLWESARNAVSLLIIITVFLFALKFMPDKKISFSSAVFGAVFSAIAWLTISIGFSFYVNNLKNYSVIYGSIGGIIILLIWLYMSAFVLLLGNQINVIISRHIIKVK